MAGYNCQFVSPPKELQHECSICLCVLRDPCLLDCECSKKFCRDCITPIREQNGRCPHCRSAFTSLISENSLGRELLQRRVYCSNKNLGCRWQGELRKLDQHVSLRSRSDGFGIPCKYCKKSFKCSAVKDHEEKDCGLRPFSCKYCQWHTSTYDNVTKTHWPVCPRHPVSCPKKCGESPERKNLDRHVDNDCPLTVVDCDFHYAGCAVRLPRKDMPDHLKLEVVSHTSLQATYSRVELVEKKKQVEQLEEQIHQLKQQMFSTERRIDDKMDQKIYSIKSQVPSNQELKQYVDQLQKQIDEAKTVFSFALVVLLIVTAVGFAMVAEQKVAVLRSESSQSLMRVIENFAVLYPDVWKEAESKPNLLSFGFTMEQFSEFKKNNSAWHSPPFYSHSVFGYKMVFVSRVHFIEKVGTQLYVSVFVDLMQGEFDDQLKWPFQGSITIQLLNQRGGEEEEGKEGHLVTTLRLVDCGRVKENSQRHCGYGQLECTSAYSIVNDQLHFGISIRSGLEV